MTKKDTMFIEVPASPMAEMPGRLEFALNFWVCERGSSSRWRMASTRLDRAVNSIALVKIEGPGARALAASCKRGDRLRCAHGYRRFEARVVGKGPQVASLWFAAGDILGPIFSLSLAIDPLAAPMPQLDEPRAP